MLFRVLTGRKVRIYIWIYRKAHRRSAWKFCKDKKNSRSERLFFVLNLESIILQDFICLIGIVADT